MFVAAPVYATSVSPTTLLAKNIVSRLLAEFISDEPISPDVLL